MARLAAAETPGFTVDDRELRRAGLSYTVLTLEELRRAMGANIPLCLLIGADALAGFTTWHRWRRFRRWLIWWSCAGRTRT